MAWVVLAVAGLMEVGWAVGLKYAEGFTRLLPTLLTGVSMLASVGLLAWAMRVIPMGTAYAVWTGIGAVGTVLVGMVLFDDPATPGRLFFVGLVVAGIVGLWATSAGH